MKVWLGILIGMVIGMGMANLVVRWMRDNNESLHDERERTYVEIMRLSDRMEELRRQVRSGNEQANAILGIAEELRQRCR